MGAIIGKFSFDSEEILARTVLDRMLETSVRRAIDVRSVFAVPGIALGACGASHPNAVSHIGISDRQTIRAVADSQLTNAGELRATLESEGHRFHARTDEELIAHAYDRWDASAFERLRGPFACAVWDEPKRRLVLARDHIVSVRCTSRCSLATAWSSRQRFAHCCRTRASVREWCPDAIRSPTWPSATFPRR
jgi:asparagine synthase (glutamine-hydrolysing)